MTKQDIINYVKMTPYNTNIAVLSGMLDSFQSGDNKEEIELSATENKVYTPDEGKVYKKVTVNVPEPPSDITTAQVTLAYGGGGMVNNYIGFPTIENDVIHSSILNAEGTYTVPLYKGSIVISTNGQAATVISGDAEISDGNIIVTGDCSLSVYVG